MRLSASLLLLLAAAGCATGSVKLSSAASSGGAAFIPANNAHTQAHLQLKTNSLSCSSARPGLLARRAGRSPLLSLRASETQEKQERVVEGKEEEPIASYDKSGGGVKALVSGLTGLVNSVMRKDGEVPEDRPERPQISLKELRDGIEGDYRRNYLWTGDIDPDLYDWECVFTDPTLSFQGLTTFQKNLANLRPIIDALVREYRVDLYRCELQQDKGKVSASWRMYGKLALPWNPAIDLKGSTVFTYAADRGNRIVDYAETWETPAGTVLLDLLRPAKEVGN